MAKILGKKCYNTLLLTNLPFLKQYHTSCKTIVRSITKLLIQKIIQTIYNTHVKNKCCIANMYTGNPLILNKPTHYQFLLHPS